MLSQNVVVESFDEIMVKLYWLQLITLSMKFIHLWINKNHLKVCQIDLESFCMVNEQNSIDGNSFKNILSQAQHSLVTDTNYQDRWFLKWLIFIPVQQNTYYMIEI